MIEIFLQDLIEKKENFDSKNENEYSVWSFIWSVLWKLFWNIISFYAVYLSWTCKSNQKQNIYLRIFFAVLAYIFGMFYIILNIFYNECRIDNTK
jgi:hypothetical protein